MEHSKKTRKHSIRNLAIPLSKMRMLKSQGGPFSFIVEVIRQSAPPPGAIPPKYSTRIFLSMIISLSFCFSLANSTRPHGFFTPALICLRYSHLTGTVFGGFAPEEWPPSRMRGSQSTLYPLRPSLSSPEVGKVERHGLCPNQSYIGPRSVLKAN